MAIPLFFARQLSHPTGFAGRLVAWFMNRVNAKMNAQAVGLIEPAPTDAILEVGFGGGPNLALLCERAAHVVGVERSKLALARAQGVFDGPIKAGRLALVEGEVHAMPLPDGDFDKALTINTIYFWPDRPTALRELARVLTPGGRLVIGFMSAEQMAKADAFPREVFSYVRPEDLTVELAAAGFESVRIDRPEGADWVFAVATRARKPLAQ